MKNTKRLPIPLTRTVSNRFYYFSAMPRERRVPRLRPPTDYFVWQIPLLYQCRAEARRRERG